MNDRDSIEAADAPIVFKIEGVDLVAPAAADDLLTFRTAARALTGMQKEAYVAQSGSPVIWRMVCDEGPYLNGTDLAPPPLGFFSAGMASAYAEAIQKSARDHGCDLASLRIVQDNHYSMEGSAIRGTMIGGAQPVELSISVSIANGSASISDVVANALATSPIDALMRDALTDTFSIMRNGKPIPTGAVAATENAIPADPGSLFADSAFDSGIQAIDDAITKVEATESVADPVHGAGASMKETQKRTLHVRSTVALRDDGLRGIHTHLHRPIGSAFRFLSDDSEAIGGLERAPSGLAYASAGIAFCFMTQLGRYAGIVKKDLADYGIVQDTAFDFGSGKTLPIDTHTFLTTSEDDATAQKYVDMGEQTCFLHAACRLSNKTRVKILD